MRVPDHGVGPGVALADAQALRAFLQQHGRRSAGVDAVELGVEAQQFGALGMAIGQGIPFRAALQACELGLGDIVAGEIAVQRAGEGQRLGAGVARAQRQAQATRLEMKCQRELELVLPQRARALAAAQRKLQAGHIRAKVIGGGEPGQMAREAVLGQIATLVELRPADRHAAADRRAAVECAARTQEQALAPARDPGQQMATVLGHQQLVATGQAQPPAVQAGEGFRHQGGARAHGISRAVRRPVAGRLRSRGRRCRSNGRRSRPARPRPRPRTGCGCRRGWTGRPRRSRESSAPAPA